MEVISNGELGLAPLSPDITGKVVVVNHTTLDRTNQSPRFQLVKVTGGFGTQDGGPNNLVFGIFIADGRDARVTRSDLIGEATRSLIDRALSDNRATARFDLSERIYMLVAKDQSRARGDTPHAAMERLRRITQSPVMMAYRMHPASKILSTGFIEFPDGAPPELVQLKKGEEWIANN